MEKKKKIDSWVAIEFDFFQEPQIKCKWGQNIVCNFIFISIGGNFQTQEQSEIQVWLLGFLSRLKH